MKIFASLNGFAVFGIVFAVIALIALIAFIIYRRMRLKMKDTEVKPTEEEILKEEMDRRLQPIEDEEISKKVSEYKEDDE